MNKYFVYNDGKEKEQSFEAWSNVCDEHGFGATPQHAILAHRRIVEDKATELQSFIDVGFSYPIVPVDCFGEEQA